MSESYSNGRNVEKSRAARRRWYAKNQSKSISKTAARCKELQDWLREFKSTLTCSRCPESHPACLEFHHRDPKMKDRTVSKAIRWGWSKERILSEIDKCDVLCANCHRKHHHPGY